MFILLIHFSSQSKKCKIKPNVTNWNIVCIFTLTSSIKSHYRHKGTKDFTEGCTVCGSTSTQWIAVQFNINPPQGQGAAAPGNGRRLKSVFINTSKKFSRTRYQSYKQKITLSGGLHLLHFRLRNFEGVLFCVLFLKTTLVYLHQITSLVSSWSC